MYVTNGVIKVKLAENTLEIHEGEGLFINSNVVHEIRDANEGARLYSLEHWVAQCHGIYQFYLC